MEKRLSKMNRIDLIDAMTELLNEKEALTVSLAEAKKAARETQSRLTQKEKELDENRSLMLQMQEQLIDCRCRLAAAEAKLETMTQAKPQVEAQTETTKKTKYESDSVRNIGVIAPVQKDKTELAEAILRIKRPKRED